MKNCRFSLSELNTEEIDLEYKHVRTAGFGKGLIKNDEFINIGLRPEVFNK